MSSTNCWTGVSKPLPVSLEMQFLRSSVAAPFCSLSGGMIWLPPGSLQR